MQVPSKNQYHPDDEEQFLANELVVKNDTFEFHDYENVPWETNICPGQKRSRTKSPARPCKSCSKIRFKLSRHILSTHKNYPEVLKLKSYSLNSLKRALAMFEWESILLNNRKQSAIGSTAYMRGKLCEIYLLWNVQRVMHFWAEGSYIVSNVQVNLNPKSRLHTVYLDIEECPFSNIHKESVFGLHYDEVGGFCSNGKMMLSLGLGYLKKICPW